MKVGVKYEFKGGYWYFVYDKNGNGVLMDEATLLKAISKGKVENASIVNRQGARPFARVTGNVRAEKYNVDVPKNKKQVMSVIDVNYAQKLLESVAKASKPDMAEQRKIYAPERYKETDVMPKTKPVNKQAEVVKKQPVAPKKVPEFQPINVKVKSPKGVKDDYEYYYLCLKQDIVSMSKTKTTHGLADWLVNYIDKIKRCGNIRAVIAGENKHYKTVEEWTNEYGFKGITKWVEEIDKTSDKPLTEKEFWEVVEMFANTEYEKGWQMLSDAREEFKR